MNDNSIQEPESLGEAFKNGYDSLFGKQWPIWVGGILFGMINVFMFAFERPWSSANGIRNWGNWFFNSLEVTDITIISPHLFSTSLLNFGIIGGAFASALLAKQFQVRMAPTRELIKGLLGGTLMGVGSALSFGCNIGGFFSATSALSLAGPAMMIGLIVGSFIGLKLLVWEITYLSPAVLKKSASSSQGDTSSNSQQPLVGFIIILIALGLTFTYDHFDYSTRGGFLLFGLIIGILMQRTRFCWLFSLRCSAPPLGLIEISFKGQRVHLIPHGRKLEDNTVQVQYRHGIERRNFQRQLTTHCKHIISLNEPELLICDFQGTPCQRHISGQR